MSTPAPAPPRAYWGLRAICDRMGWRTNQTAIAQLIRTGFPIYRRPGSDGRYRWFTDEGLINAWQLAQVRAERERVSVKPPACTGIGQPYSGPRNQGHGRNGHHAASQAHAGNGHTATSQVPHASSPPPAPPSQDEITDPNG